MDALLLIYFYRATNTYERYEIYPLGKTTVEQVYAKVQKYNNSNQDTYIKVFEDSFWIDFINDVNASFTRRNLISSLKDIVYELKNCTESLDSWTDDIQEQLEDWRNNV